MPVGKDPAVRAREEAGVRALTEAGRFADAVVAALAANGSELLSFLLATMSSAVLANDAYSQLQVMLLDGMPRFAWRSSLRTWMYTITRHARARVLRSMRAGSIPLSQAGELVAPLPTSTPPYLRTTIKDRLTAVRDALPEDDRELLILRVDRELGWSEIAEVLEVDEPALRKRFQRLKAKLRDAIAAGD